MKLMDRIAYKVAEKNFTAIFRLASYDDIECCADTMKKVLDSSGLQWTDIIQAFEGMMKAKNEGRPFPFYDSDDLAVVQIWNLMDATFWINLECLIGEIKRARGSRA